MVVQNKNTHAESAQMSNNEIISVSTKILRVGYAKISLPKRKKEKKSPPKKKKTANFPKQTPNERTKEKNQPKIKCVRSKIVDKITNETCVPRAHVVLPLVCFIFGRHDA